LKKNGDVLWNFPFSLGDLHRALEHIRVWQSYFPKKNKSGEARGHRAGGGGDREINLCGEKKVGVGLFWASCGKLPSKLSDFTACFEDFGLTRSEEIGLTGLFLYRAGHSSNPLTLLTFTCGAPTSLNSERTSAYFLSRGV